MPSIETYRWKVIGHYTENTATVNCMGVDEYWAGNTLKTAETVEEAERLIREQCETNDWTLNETKVARRIMRGSLGRRVDIDAYIRATGAFEYDTTPEDAYPCIAAMINDEWGCIVIYPNGNFKIDTTDTECPMEIFASAMETATQPPYARPIKESEEPLAKPARR